MRVVVVGGGKIGGYLSRELRDGGHSVTVIEANPEQAERLAESTTALVMNGDGTDIENLRNAHVDRADWLIAVTGADEVNLVACELGGTLGAKHSLARLNDPRNRPTFAALGIPVVGVTGLIGELIERELEREFLERVTILAAGAISVIEVTVPEGTEARVVEDLDLPDQALVITVVDGEGHAAVPGPKTVIRSGSKVVAVTALDREPMVRDVLLGGR